jgi:hypothetical protein
VLSKVHPSDRFLAPKSSLCDKKCLAVVHVEGEDRFG